MSVQFVVNFIDEIIKNPNSDAIDLAERVHIRK